MLRSVYGDRYIHVGSLRGRALSVLIVMKDLSFTQDSKGGTESA
jgi:hypothetical protein